MPLAVRFTINNILRCFAGRRCILHSGRRSATEQRILMTRKQVAYL